MIKHFFIYSVIAITLFSCSKTEGEGGRSSISGTITGTEISSSRAEITQITAVPGHEIKSQDFFLLNTPSSTDNYAFWFRDLTNITGAPIITNRVLIKIDFSSGVSDNVDIATSIESTLNAIIGTPFTTVRNGDILTITNTSVGNVSDGDNANSKLVVDVLTQGKNEITLQSGAFADEDVYIIYGDKDDIFDDNTKTNYDGTFKFSNLRKGTYKIFAYNKDESSVSEPLTPVFESIEISGNEDADIGTITIEKK